MLPKSKRPKAWYFLFAVALGTLLAACGGQGGSGGGQPPSSITLTVQDSQNTGYIVAFQVGNGNWTAQSPNPSHTYTLNLGTQSKYGVAVYCNQNSSLHIIHATNTELGNATVVCSSPAGGPPSLVPYTLNLNVSQTGAQIGDIVFVQGSGVSHSGTPVTSLSNVQASIQAPEGTQDILIIVARGDPDNPSSLQILHAEVLRNVNVTNGGSSNHTLGAPLGTGTVTISNVPSGFSGLPLVFYLSKDNKGAGVVGWGSGNTFTYRQVRGFSQGDRYFLNLMYQNPSGSSRILYLKGSSGGDIGVTLPNPWQAAALSVDGNAHPTVSGLNRTEPSLKACGIDLQGSELHVLGLVTKGWLGSNTSYVVPNLSSVLTYTPFASGSRVSASILAVFSPNALDLGATNLDPTTFTANLDFAFIGANGYYTVGGGSIQLP